MAHVGADHRADHFEWLMSGQTIVPTIRKTKPKSMA